MEKKAPKAESEAGKAVVASSAIYACAMLPIALLIALAGLEWAYLEAGTPAAASAGLCAGCAAGVALLLSVSRAMPSEGLTRRGLLAFVAAAAAAMVALVALLWAMPLIASAA